MNQAKAKAEHWEKYGKKEYAALTRRVNRANKQDNFHGVVKIHKPKSIDKKEVGGIRKALTKAMKD